LTATIAKFCLQNLTERCNSGGTAQAASLGVGGILDI
jgi:hypothetical protein